MSTSTRRAQETCRQELHALPEEEPEEAVRSTRRVRTLTGGPHADTITDSLGEPEGHEASADSDLLRQRHKPVRTHLRTAADAKRWTGLETPKVDPQRGRQRGNEQ